MKNYLIAIALSILIIGCENSISSNDDNNILINDYASGSACGGSILNFNDNVYRTTDIGIAPFDKDLNINRLERIGNFQVQIDEGNVIYHAEKINNQIWFSLTNYSTFNQINVVDNFSNIINTYDVGINPGDFAYWNDESSDASWVFIANEGSYGTANGSISMIDQDGNINETEPLGMTVHSIEVYNNKLIVLINGDNRIKIYDISENGLAAPGIEISTENSGPREMVIVNDILYFTNQTSKDIKKLNLNTYGIESILNIDGIPEDIVSDGSKLWISIPMLELYDINNGSKVIEIDIQTEQVINSYDVGRGPEQLELFNNNLYVARKYYDNNFDWNPLFGSSKIILDR